MATPSAAFPSGDFAHVKIKKSTIGTVGYDTGDGLFATKAFKPGDVMMIKSDVMMAVPSLAYFEQVCATCFAYCPAKIEPGTVPWDLRGGQFPKLMKCAGCKEVCYCSKECQVKGWKQGLHRVECPIYQRINENKPTGEVAKRFPGISSMLRQCIRTIARYKVGGANSPEWQEFIKLTSLFDEYLETQESRPETMRNIAMISQALQHFIPTSLEIIELPDIVTRLRVNAMTLTALELEPVGSCLDPVAARINHSCQPNSWIHFVGSQMRLTALTDIDKNAEITITYVEPLQEVYKRQEQLYDQYNFNCECPLCTARPSLPKKEMKARRLQADKVKGFQMPDGDPLEPSFLPKEDLLPFEQALDKLKDTWPIVEQPYSYLHKRLAKSRAAYGEWGGNKGAIAHYMKLHGEVYPAVYQYDCDPGRLMSALADFHWCLSKSSENPPAAEEDKIQLTRLLIGLIKYLKQNTVTAYGPQSEMTQFIDKKYVEFRQDLPDIFRQELP